MSGSGSGGMMSGYMSGMPLVMGRRLMTGSGSGGNMEDMMLMMKCAMCSAFEPCCPDDMCGETPETCQYGDNLKNCCSDDGDTNACPMECMPYTDCCPTDDSDLCFGMADIDHGMCEDHAMACCMGMDCPPECEALKPCCPDDVGVEDYEVMCTMACSMDSGSGSGGMMSGYMSGMPLVMGRRLMSNLPGMGSGDTMPEGLSMDPDTYMKFCVAGCMVSLGGEGQCESVNVMEIIEGNGSGEPMCPEECCYMDSGSGSGGMMSGYMSGMPP